MISFILGIVVGILLSIVAVINGKHFEKEINQPIQNRKKAEIIKKKDESDIFS